MSGIVTLQNPRIVGLSYSFTGNLPTSDYGKRIETPPNTNKIVKFFWSAAGGVLVWEDLQDNINSQVFIAGNVYPIYNVSRVLASGETWQGNIVTNTITDLEFAGD